jgi:PAS domain S-box-containing protein
MVQTHRIISALVDVVSTLRDAESGQRGYLLTGHDQYLQPYRAAVAHAPDALQELDKVTVKHPTHEERVVRLRQLAQDKLDELRETLDLQAAGHTEEALRVVRSDRGQRTMDAIRRLSGEMEAEEDLNLRRRLAESRGSVGLTRLLSLIVTAAAVVLLGLVWLLVRRDVTGTERAQLAHSRLAAMVESSEDAIIGKSLDGTIQTWNAAAARLYGYSAEEAVGQSMFLLVPPERADELKAIMEKMRRGERIADYETTRLCKDGRRVDVSVRVSPVRDERGRLVGASAIARDISERRRAEAELAHLLEREQAARAEAERLYDEVQEEARRKDQFLAMLAHELRNPLAPICNAVHIVGHLPIQNPTLDRVRGILDRNVRHLARIVDDLLEVSRITRGKIELQREPLDLARVIRVTAEDHRAECERAGLMLSVEVGEPAWVEADPTRVAQILSNLLHNALKFTASGGRICVRLKVDQEQHRAVVEVEDTGMGMEPELLTRVWDVFSQGDTTLARTQGGLGLGLPLVKGLVELHGGQVDAASAGPGKGARFRFALLLREEESPLETAPPDAPPEPPRLRILVVEDNRDTAESLKLVLGLAGHDVVIACTGPEGVATAQEVRPDVLLCDLGLPGLDGFGVARALRQDPALGSMRLVALSGYGQPEDKAEALAAGFECHLTKPIDPSELVRALASAPQPS